MRSQDDLSWLGRPVGEDQRAKILACAQAEFSEQGYRNAKMKAIATHTGVGKTTIYKYFSSKEELFLAVVRENLNHIHELALAGLVSGGPPWERLETSARSILAYVEENRNILRVMFQETGEFDGGIQKQFIETIGVNMPIGEAFIQSFQNEGTFRKQPAHEVIGLLLNLLIGTTYAWSLHGEGSLVERGMAYLEMLKQGFLKNDN
jgi:AcrR family transcriptional regulator